MQVAVDVEGHVDAGLAGGTDERGDVGRHRLRGGGTGARSLAIAQQTHHLA